MKGFAKRLLRKIGRVMAQDAIQEIRAILEESHRASVRQVEDAVAPLSRMLQRTLCECYRFQSAAGPARDLERVGFNVYSETHEDGILLYIFSILGMETRRCVDIGAAGIMRSNVANLIVNHGFDALLIDANTKAIEEARAFYEQRRSTLNSMPKIVNSFVTAEDINSLIAQNGFAGNLDLLCIDIDGNDYWIWKALDAVSPNVVIVEYQDILGPERSWTIPYKPDFSARDYEVNQTNANYCGASLRAFVNLAKAKGYRLVGCNRNGWNAFFVRNSLSKSALPEVSVESCFHHEWNTYGIKERFPLVKDMEWVEV